MTQKSDFHGEKKRRRILLSDQRRVSDNAASMKEDRRRLTSNRQNRIGEVRIKGREVCAMTRICSEKTSNDAVRQVLLSAAMGPNGV